MRLKMPELEHLRNFASSARRGGFGVPFFKMDGNTGKYHRTGKTNADAMNHQKLACDAVDAMTGWRKFENKIPIYQLGRVSAGYAPAAREELGDLNERLWPDGKDPWEQVYLLPFWDVESREVLLFSATNRGSRDAVAALIGAYLNDVEVHPEDLHRVPLIELESDSYVNKHGKRIYVPIFSILDWIDRPVAMRRILPPPVQMLQLKVLPAPTGTPATQPTPAKSDKRTPVVKAKAKNSTNTESSKLIDFDDEVLFAPEWRG
jgi:hypothetical protein